MRIVCRIKEQASETARCKNDISCKDRAHFAVFVLAHNTLANIILFNKINHSGFWNYGYIFFFLCNVKKSICNFLACFCVMVTWMQFDTFPIFYWLTPKHKCFVASLFFSFKCSIRTISP